MLNFLNQTTSAVPPQKLAIFGSLCRWSSSPLGLFLLWYVSTCLSELENRAFCFWGRFTVILHRWFSTSTMNWVKFEFETPCIVLSPQVCSSKLHRLVREKGNSLEAGYSLVSNWMPAWRKWLYPRNSVDAAAWSSFNSNGPTPGHSRI